jgi:hypothetical protein
MRVIRILQDLFITCRAHIDLRLLHTLFSSIEALTRCRKLTITSIGRSLSRDCLLKHKIKAVDRLFGNSRVQKKISLFYKSIVDKIIFPQSQPIIIIDWSRLTQCGKYHFLRAAVPVGGRALPILEMVFEEKEYGSQKSHSAFLCQLKSILPRDCIPIILTDAGFRNSWFRLILKFKWNYIGRIRHRTKCQLKGKERWESIKLFYGKAKHVPQFLGNYLLSKKNQLNTNLYLYKEYKKHRIRKNLKGNKKKCGVSLQHAKREAEPWVLATSLDPKLLDGQKIINIYKKRMQIEEGLRDLKNERMGLSLRQNRSMDLGRLNMALLIGAMTLFLLWILGTMVKNKNLHYQYQANTVRNRNVLSNFLIGWQALEEKRIKFSKVEVNQTIIAIGKMLCA